jgi:hypothetical protein
MKKLYLKLFSVFMALLLVTVQTHVLSAKTLDVSLPGIEEAVFNLDEQSLDQAMAELNLLDDYLNENEGVTFSDLQNMGSSLIANFSDIAAPMGASQEGDLPLGIPAFWWGCILGWVGILLVYIFTDNDKEQTKKALNGCLISTGISVVLYVLYIAVLVDSTNDL